MTLRSLPNVPQTIFSKRSIQFLIDNKLRLTDLQFPKYSDFRSLSDFQKTYKKHINFIYSLKQQYDNYEQSLNIVMNHCIEERSYLESKEEIQIQYDIPRAHPLKQIQFSCLQSTDISVIGNIKQKPQSSQSQVNKSGKLTVEPFSVFLQKSNLTNTAYGKARLRRKYLESKK
ncbi:hypothetical protein SS50377_26443 [Spironucleus salmonicida]|uniref:Uncharacterized protein n=1 Tax=Spironucleus salmonicida TaxID=348837 RepID=V6LAQ6_9EUKA|nr:hypothetical protein SS50377_26443 [Spironucleus salmonicida]|eukprot:EST41303.1 Hypothetical protein SS50377_19015 [Spironucleus salmonicida]